MDGIRAAPLGALLVALAGHAQVAPESCATGDTQCYERQLVQACTQRESATVQGCRAFIAGLEGRAQADREARRAQGSAHQWAGLYLIQDPSEKATSLARAREVFEELAKSDPRDTEALLGLATLAPDDVERLNLLRRVVRLKPGDHLDVSFLITQLRKSGSRQDLLEAAAAAETAYSLNLERPVWRMAAAAIDLYTEAAESARAEKVRVEARRKVTAASLPDELATAIRNDLGRAASLLSTLCDQSMRTIAGDGPCERGVATVKAARATAADGPRAEQLQELQYTYQGILDGSIVRTE